jgi:hypothetical protein
MSNLWFHHDCMNMKASKSLPLQTLTKTCLQPLVFVIIRSSLCTTLGTKCITQARDNTSFKIGVILTEQKSALNSRMYFVGIMCVNAFDIHFQYHKR